jgi:RimJ/RimL family protein N-acetyltransferase
MEPKFVDDSFNTHFEDIKFIDFTDAWHLNNGARIVLRPVKPEDSVLLSAMMARLSSRSKYNRFHGTVNNLSSAQLQYMSCVDQQRHVAFVLTTQKNGEEHIIADARYVIDENSSNESAEFAIMVEDHWQRFGLAKHAMHALTTTASNNGLRWLHGDVFAENCPMLALMKRCHFFCTPDRSDQKMVHAEILLNTTQHLAVTSRHTLGHYLSQWMKSLRKIIHQIVRGARYA